MGVTMKTTYVQGILTRSFLGNLYLRDRERDGIALIRNLRSESASWIELAEYYVQ